jgi:hypothetical protein
MVRGLITAGVLLVSTAAMAGDRPTYTFLSDGTLEARVTVDAPVDTIKGVLANPKVRQDMSADVFSIEEKAREGRCNKLQTKTRGMWRPLAVFSLFCPTDKGFVE